MVLVKLIKANDHQHCQNLQSVCNPCLMCSDIIKKYNVKKIICLVINDKKHQKCI